MAGPRPVEQGTERPGGREAGCRAPRAGGRLLPRALAVSLLSGTALILSSPIARTATITFTGATSDDWFDPTNWDTGTVPTSADTAIVDGAVVSRIAGQAPGQPTAATGQVAVGTAVNGQLDIVDQLTTDGAAIGNAAGAVGTVNVIGNRAVWTNGQDIAVGTTGTGALNLSGDATVSSGTATVAATAASSGSVALDGAGTRWTVDDGLLLGDAGAGTLAVAGGSTVTAGRTVLGSRAGSNGWAAIFGTGSSLQSSGDLVVGDAGTGTLEITAGGVASNGAAVIGNDAGGRGAVSVIGDGSLWQSRDAVSIGVAGQGSLAVSDGGTVQGTAATLGLEAGGTGTATVTGRNSLWSLSGQLGIGGDAAAATPGGTGSLAIGGGGTVAAGSVTLGNAVGSDGRLSVTGGVSPATGVAASSLAVAGDLAIGTVGNGTASIGDGGRITATSSRLGVASGASGSASVEGDGSLWDAGLLTVGVAGTGAVTVTAGGALASGEAVIAADIDASGAASTVAILGAGSRWTSDSTIRVGGAGSGRLDVAAGGSVADLDAVVGGSTGGQGTAVVDGTGSLWQTQDNLIIGGSGDGLLTVSAGGGVTAGDVTIAAAAGSTGAVTIAGTGSSLLADTLAVGGVGDGTLTLTGGASVTAREIRIAAAAGSAGTLNIGAAAGAMAAGGGILDADRVVFGGGNGRLVINTGGATNNLGFDISGNGSVAQYGGDTVLAGDSSYTGGTEVRGGALALATSTAAGTGGIRLFDDTRLALAGGITAANDIAFGDRTALTVAAGTAAASGTLSGNGSLAIDGAGTLVLSGDGSAYSGAASLSGGGGLVVDGTLGGSLDILSGGTLGGDGTVGDTLVRNGGTVAPGKLAVAGDITFDTGSALEITVAGNGDNDRIDASGSATLNGGTVVVTALDPAISYRDGQSYTILTADGGVTGTFDGTRFASIFLDASLQYQAGSVTLSVTPDNAGTPGFVSVAETPNQRAAASGLAGFGQVVGLDTLIVYNQILFSPTEAAARRAFDLSSGEIHATGQTALAGASQLFTETLRARAGLLGDADTAQPPALPPAAAEQAQRLQGGSTGMAALDPGTVSSVQTPTAAFDLWGGTFGQSARREGDGNAAALDSRTTGIVGGADLATLDLGALGALTAGLGFGYSRTDADVSARLSQADIESAQFGLYASLEKGPLLVSAAGSYGHHDVDINRQIVFGSIDRLATSSTTADSFGFSGEARYRLTLGGLTIAPLATLEIARIAIDGTREHGANSLDLITEDEDYTAGDAGVGLALGYGWSIGSGHLRSEIRAAYERGFGDAPEQTLSFLGGPVRFTVIGADARANRLALGVGLRADFANGLSLTGSYDGAFGSDGDVHSGHLSAGYRF